MPRPKCRRSRCADEATSMTTTLWIVSVLLIVIGVAGTVLPALPGVPLIFGGVLLAAWIGYFQRISVFTVVVLAVLAVVGIVIDYIAAAISAKRAGPKIGRASCRER